jgi:hypothetical protein
MHNELTPLIITLSTTLFGYEKVIDLGFWETPYTIILPRLGLVSNISNFKITGYETRISVKMSKKCQVRRGPSFWWTKTQQAYMNLYIQSDIQLIQSIKSSPHIVLTTRSIPWRHLGFWRKKQWFVHIKIALNSACTYRRWNKFRIYCFSFWQYSSRQFFPYWTRFIKVNNFGGLGTSCGLSTFPAYFFNIILRKHALWFAWSPLRK